MIAMNDNAPSARVLDVRARFGLSPRDRRLQPDDAQRQMEGARWIACDLRPGSVSLLVGASGAGKTTLLRQICQVALDPIVDLGAIRLRDMPAIDCLPRLSVGEALSWLGRFGLGEVWSYLTPASRLSQGQQFRLRLAIAMDRARYRASSSGRAIVVADEFANSLDGITARIVARNLRRALVGSPIAVVLASSRDDLESALRPDQVVHCDFGRWERRTAAAEETADD